MKSADPNDGKTGLSVHNKIDRAISTFTALLLPCLVWLSILGGGGGLRAAKRHIIITITIIIIIIMF
jgi:hypothetical protein